MKEKSNIRINKYLSLCGLGSRRKVEELILGGKIKLNGLTVNDLSTAVDASKDIVEFNGKKLCKTTKPIYLVLNKPKGFITSFSDEMDRSTVMDLIPDEYKSERLFPVGRLDKDSEGLLLFTNDGDMAYKLSHPKFGVPKEYIVVINKPLSDIDKSKLERGVILYGRKTAHAIVTILDNKKTHLKIEIHEGKKRQIRESLKTLGYHAKKLKRISYGTIKLGELRSAHMRFLKTSEINSLKEIVNKKFQPSYCGKRFLPFQ